MAKLKNKTAIVTGATGGIGEATAKHLLEEGANVMLVARSREKLDATLARLGHKPNVAGSVADAIDEAATASAVQATVQKFGGVDCLFANAGTEGLMRPIAQHTVEGFEDVLRTNVTGVFLSIKHCVEAMKKRGGGSIVAVSSIAGVVGSVGLCPYNASKHAVIGMVKSAALELGPSGIRVNAIAPGPIDNRMIRSLETQRAPENPDQAREFLKTLIPLRRYGTNEEVARLVAFLLSDESAFCTGGVHMIDGGYTAA